MEDLEFIKKFTKITIKNVCSKVKVDRYNLVKNKTTKKNIKLVREEIENQIARLYIKDENYEQQEKN